MAPEVYAIYIYILYVSLYICLCLNGYSLEWPYVRSENLINFISGQVHKRKLNIFISILQLIRLHFLMTI